ncbi:MAG TPA: carboxypeptidase regulatory-like domain-containing protein [Acidobacteriota bacterium]|nr:carboxypeptidase regulatory-like domain-containing protein [Acidobacteriota bacterium]
MGYDRLEQMRREERMRNLVLLGAVCAVVLLLAGLYLVSLPSGRQAVSPERSISDAAPIAEERIAEPEAEQVVETPVAEQEAPAAVAESVAEETVSAETVEAPEQVAVGGIVLRRGHNTPVRRLRLALVNDEGVEAATTRTGADGSFSFEGVADGKYHLQTVSGNFSYRRHPVVVAGGAAEEIRFDVLPRAPRVDIPRYSAFRPDEQVAAIDVGVFRFGRIVYSVYKLDLSGSFINAASFDDILSADVSTLESLEQFERRYDYDVPFSQESERLVLDASDPGLYLVEARAGSDSFRGLVSLGSLDVVTTQSGSRLEVLVLGLGGGTPSALVKASSDGLLIGEGETDAGGKFVIELGRFRSCELMVSDGSSFYFAATEIEPKVLASR